MSLDKEVVEQLKIIAIETRRFTYEQPGYWSNQAKAIELIRPFYKDTPSVWSAYFGLYKTYVANGVDKQ